MTSFTVAIPTHDRRDTVVLAVRSALRQTHPPEQVIVTCDGCTDGTADALRALGDERVVAVELEKGRGYAYGHRNVALAQATGDVVVWLADDDLLLPDHLERLDERWGLGDVDLVTTPAVVVAPDDGLEWIGRDWSVPWFRSALEHGNSNVMASVSARTALLRAIGGWDDAIERAADWDLWKRALAAGGRPAALDDPTVLHFRATGRVQAWPLRVEQNARWLDRIGDPAALRALRPELRRTRSLTDALQAEHQAFLDRHIEATEARLAQCEGTIIARDAAIAEQAATIEELRRVAASDADRIAELERHHATLEAIYAGGWWRLRGVVRAVVSRVPWLRRSPR